MNFHSLALKIANSEQTSALKSLVKLITPEIKENYSISKFANPFSKGSNSAVYINNSGNIVSFMIGAGACEAAYKTVGQNFSFLPEIYELDIIMLDGNKVCVIEMEQLTPLNNFEERSFIEVIVEVSEFAELRSIFDVTLDNIISYFENKKLLGDISPFESALLSLVNKMSKDNIYHDDFHEENVAWGGDGELKLIDWESISIL